MWSSPPTKIPLFRKIRWSLLNPAPSNHQKSQFLGKSGGFSSIWSHLTSSTCQKHQFLGKSGGFSSISPCPISSTHQKSRFWRKLLDFSPIWTCPTTKNVNFGENCGILPQSGPIPPQKMWILGKIVAFYLNLDPSHHKKCEFWGKLWHFTSIWTRPATKNVNF